MFTFSPVASRNIRDIKHKNWNTAMILRIREMYDLSILFYSEGVIFSLTLGGHKTMTKSDE